MLKKKSTQFSILAPLTQVCRAVPYHQKAKHLLLMEAKRSYLPDFLPPSFDLGLVPPSHSISSSWLTSLQTFPQLTSDLKVFVDTTMEQTFIFPHSKTNKNNTEEQFDPVRLWWRILVLRFTAWRDKREKALGQKSGKKKGINGGRTVRQVPNIRGNRANWSH